MRFLIYSGALLGLWATLAYAKAPAPVGYSTEAMADHVPWENLPGAQHIIDNVTFNQFTGYIPVNPTTGKNYFYWFFESQGNPATDPVVLWTNGGPGCSGFLGLFTELGPIRPDNQGELLLNPYSWNAYANFIFIEQPTGVGFTYSDTEEDYTVGDDQAAHDMYDFLQGWFKRYPQFQGNDFYITSESYGGHYMPTLAWEILTRQKSSKTDIPLNFKGLAVGNPYTDAFINNNAMFDKFWGDQLIPKVVYDLWKVECTDKATRPKNEDFCDALEQKMFSAIGNLNPYALNYPVCVSDSDPSGSYAQRQFLIDQTTKLHLDIHADYQPCEEDFTANYLNRADVQQAIGAKLKANTTWMSCSQYVNYNRDDGQNPMQGYYNKIIDSGANLKILVYSGDDDSICATEGTQEWIFNLGYQYTNLWEPWIVENQTAGYVTQFEGQLTFLTVHDAGHEVPAYRPVRGLDLWKRFLQGSWFSMAPKSVTAEELSSNE
jgi:carboxypeptidase C (cathepsin A)